MTKKGKRKARRTAQRLLVDLDVKRPPVRVETIAKQIGVVIRKEPLDDELSGMILVKDDKPIIGVNSHHHPNRQRFTIAHEIGHWLLHRSVIDNSIHIDKRYRVLQRNSESSKGDQLIEIEANAFAAELLMPEAFLKKDLDKILDIHDIDADDERIQALAKRFQVSTSAMRFRVLGFFND